VRILLDYRPALKDRTGVGEYVHELARALARDRSDAITLVSASWADRPAPELASQLPGIQIAHRRLPVRALTWSWNRLEWPPVEWLAGTADVVHGQTLLVPSRQAAQVITIHDLHFLRHPDDVHGEMRRDFPPLVRAHAHRADHVIVPSNHVAGEVVSVLGVSPEKISVCPHGAPDWAEAIAQERARADERGRLILFVGTLEPRKNIRTLLAAYERVLATRADAPPLVLVGRVAPAMQKELAPIGRAPLAGRVQLSGYVSDPRRRELYRDAAMLVLPSFEEGFGLPVIEAMAAGVPVVVSNRGALPEVAGDAASPVDPTDADALARAMLDLLDPDRAREAARRGRARAAHYTWTACARATRAAYERALAARARRTR
jgi:glycosyltransferase involved in cell wall biosynthesis